MKDQGQVFPGGRLADDGIFKEAGLQNDLLAHDHAADVLALRGDPEKRSAFAAIAVQCPLPLSGVD